MIPLPASTSDPNIRALARWARNDQTGLASASWKLDFKPVATTLLVFKNGLLLVSPGDYTVANDTITFAVALIAGDKTSAVGWARAS